jgi:hypothetical protein
VSSISAFMKQVSELVKWVKDLNFVISKCAYVTGCFVLGNAMFGNAAAAAFPKILIFFFFFTKI